MKARKSYSELMKESAMQYQQKVAKNEQNVFIEMLLSEITLKAEESRVKRKIDEALDQRDYEAFVQLSNRLIAITYKMNA